MTRLTSFNPHPARKPDATPNCRLVVSSMQMFQSSPGPKAGCYAIALLGSSIRRCVSILTRPESRMLRQALTKPSPIGSSFNPHPARKPDATIISTLIVVIRMSFNPHPARKPDATIDQTPTGSTSEVSILTRPESRMLPATRQKKAAHESVSILTRPESRMLRVTITGFYLLQKFQSSPGPKAGCYNDVLPVERRGIQVSILTRPESRMLPDERARILSDYEFQSSPGPKAGCYKDGEKALVSVLLFQSSPGPKAGCYPNLFYSIAGIACFNPHPARKPDATVCVSGSCQ